MQLAMRSPAKVNLRLKILGRYPDGYHQLETTMVKIALYDELHFTLVDQPTFTIECPGHPELETDDNLVVRVARKLCPAGKGVRIKLSKNIPHGAGLGGGSGNAAITINAMNKMFALGLGDSERLQIGAEFGADVPFFVMPWTAALATGVGTILQPIQNAAKLHLVLVVPDFRVATAWAYQRVSAPPLESRENQNALTLSVENDKKNSGSCGWNKALQVADAMENDLEKAVIPFHPRIQSIKDELLRAGGLGAMMSGSGSSVFGIFNDAADAKHAAAILESDKTLWIKALVTHQHNDRKGE